MRRRTAFGLIGTLMVAACAHQVAPSPEPALAWSLHSTELEGAKLAYGQPQSDNVLLMMTCQPRTGAVRLSVAAPEAGAPDAVRLASRGRQDSFAGEAAPSGMGSGLIVEAEARADHPVLASFAATGDLAVVENGRRARLPAAGADRQEIRSFFAACGRPA